MTRKPESRLQRRIQEALRREFPGCVVYKIHGNEFQVIGIPDLICCVNGLFIALEVKLDGKPSPAQIYEVDRINKAGGHAGFVFSVEGAINVVQDVIARAGGGVQPRNRRNR